MPMGIDCNRKLQSFDQTGNEKIFEPEVEKNIFRKIVKNCLKSPILVFWYLVTRRQQRSLKSSVKMTSSPEMVRIKKNSRIFGYWIQFFNWFYKVYLPSLRSASVSTLPGEFLKSRTLSDQDQKWKKWTHSDQDQLKFLNLGPDQEKLEDLNSTEPCQQVFESHGLISVDPYS